MALIQEFNPTVFIRNKLHKKTKQKTFQVKNQAWGPFLGFHTDEAGGRKELTKRNVQISLSSLQEFNLKPQVTLVTRRQSSFPEFEKNAIS